MHTYNRHFDVSIQQVLHSYKQTPLKIEIRVVFLAKWGYKRWETPIMEMEIGEEL
jgi:hypothetical protein